MALNTKSKFYYGFEINSLNQILNIRYNLENYQIKIPAGYYSFENLCKKIASNLNDLELIQFSVTTNREERKITIASTSPFSILFSQSPDLAGLLGFASGDLNGLASYTSPSPAGFEFSPQFFLLDYTPPEHWKTSIDKTVNVSGSGKVEVVRFGVSNFLEFSIEYQTDSQMEDSSWIESDINGVQNLVVFMDSIIKKGEIEFMPDRDNAEDFITIVLESTDQDAQGTAYRLKEMVDSGLIGFYETGKLKFRKIQGA